jgi:5-methylcytosine-specific restriction endonuclease McrA
MQARVAMDKPKQQRRIRFITRVDRLFYKLTREKKLEEQGYRCYYCGEQLSRRDATLDHVTPLASTNHHYHQDSNTVACCEKCNKEKGRKTVDEFLEERERSMDHFDRVLREICQRLEERVRQAEWRLDFKPMGSFNKWVKFHEKRGKWPKPLK